MASSNANYLPTSQTKREMSLHARKRGCQRGISPEVAELVAVFGEKKHDGHGGIRYLMTEKSLGKLRRAVGSSQKVDALAGVYVVVSATDPIIITVAHCHN